MTKYDVNTVEFRLAEDWVEAHCYKSRSGYRLVVSDGERSATVNVSTMIESTPFGFLALDCWGAACVAVDSLSGSPSFPHLSKFDMLLTYFSHSFFMSREVAASDVSLP